MPMPIYLAQKLSKRLTDVRKEEILDYLRPDGKTQVTVRYQDGVPVEVTNVLISSQHADGVDIEGTMKADFVKHIIAPVMAAEGVEWGNAAIYVNPTGRFVIGGPDGDTGLTGRKIIVDTYGGAAPHGGGAFSGKDPTKVDRSAAYVARYLAKNVVAAGLADRCTIQIAYAIGVADPMSFYVDLHGTGHVDEAKLEEVLPQMVSLKPRGIREHLGLNRPIYARTSAYGHFGRAPEADGGFSWEKTDLVSGLKRHFH
jgi:S-adenosylmethionine synthetase